MNATKIQEQMKLRMFAVSDRYSEGEISKTRCAVTYITYWAVGMLAELLPAR